MKDISTSKAASSGLHGRRSSIVAILGWAAPLFLFLYGMWTFPLALFGPDRKLLPGDLGDSRFNNYILEHFHQWTLGRVDSYWDAPFMYPQKTVIALSDNLLGSAPLYDLARRMGFTRETAFQLWIAVLFALNFLCCFIALFRWSRQAVLAACGAYLFAFGLHMIGHLEHAQVFPKFMVPLAFYWCMRWLEDGYVSRLFFALLAVVYQFWCGIYLGFILCYSLGFLVLAHVLMHSRQWRRYLPMNIRGWLGGGAALAAAILLLMPLMTPYFNASRTVGLREFSEVLTSIPRPQSYFFTHPAAINWQSLSRHSQYAFDNWWSHFHFMGALPWAAILLAPLVLWRSRDVPERRKELAVVLIAFTLSTLCCLRIGDFTLYKFIYSLPGFGALRSVDRFVPVQAMYFAIIIALVFAQTARWRNWDIALALALPVVVVLDNKVKVQELKRYDKHAAEAMVERAMVDLRIGSDSSSTAFAYAPLRSFLDPGQELDRTIHMHITSMLAGQELGMPLVNAYTGIYPPTYKPFWSQQDRASLGAWLLSNAVDPRQVALIDNVHRPVLFSDTVRLMAPNNRFLRVNTIDNSAVADGSPAGTWETLVRLYLDHTHCAFIAHNDHFLSTELHRDGGLVAVSDRMGDMCVFRIEHSGDSTIRLVADNGRYLLLDSASRRLYARGDSVDAMGLLRVRNLRH